MLIKISRFMGCGHLPKLPGAHQVKVEWRRCSTELSCSTKHRRMMIQSVAVLVIHFGTSKSPKRLRSATACKARVRPAVNNGLDEHTPSPTSPIYGLTTCRMSSQIFSAATGNTPLRHCENPPGPTPTRDYPPSLRSPWRAAVEKRTPR